MMTLVPPLWRQYRARERTRISDIPQLISSAQQKQAEIRLNCKLLFQLKLAKNYDPKQFHATVQHHYLALKTHYKKLPYRYAGMDQLVVQARHLADDYYRLQYETLPRIKGDFLEIEDKASPQAKKYYKVIKCMLHYLIIHEFHALHRLDLLSPQFAQSTEQRISRRDIKHAKQQMENYIHQITCLDSQQLRHVPRIRQANRIIELLSTRLEFSALCRPAKRNQQVIHYRIP